MKWDKKLEVKVGNAKVSWQQVKFSRNRDQGYREPVPRIDTASPVMVSLSDRPVSRTVVPIQLRLLL